MIKKTTIALAGALGMLAFAAAPANAGAADTDAAVANTMTLYTSQIPGEGTPGLKNVDATQCTDIGDGDWRSVVNQSAHTIEFFNEAAASECAGTPVGVVAPAPGVASFTNTAKSYKVIVQG